MSELNIVVLALLQGMRDSTLDLTAGLTQIREALGLLSYEEALDFFENARKSMKDGGESTVICVPGNEGPYLMQKKDNGDLEFFYDQTARLGGCKSNTWKIYTASGECDFAISGAVGKIGPGYIEASFDVKQGDIDLVKLNIGVHGATASTYRYRYEARDWWQEPHDDVEFDTVLVESFGQ